MSTSSPPATSTDRRPWWPWVILGLGLVWTILIRIPLILNAEDHLDSDLAVDGLTLLDAVHGQWRWHYPGTPYMGILPMLSSYPQALVWGANPITLVSGGTVIWGLIIVSTFWLAWRAFGSEVAGWAIVPLVFSSTGTLWLSGRITGGHLLTLFWHTLAFAGLYASLVRGGWKRAASLGFWCGLGLYIDAMFLFTLAGIVPAAMLAWLRGGRPRSGIVLAAAFLGGLVVGILPREIGRRVDPYDAYPSQFAATFEGKAVAGHARLLVVECLPRLVGGSALNDFEIRVIDPESPLGDLLATLTGVKGGFHPLRPKAWASLLIAIGFAVAMVRLAVAAVRQPDLARQAVGLGTSLSAILIVAAFLVNQNIFNSDNYRYLIFLLTPWTLGFGLAMRDLGRRGLRGRLGACLVAGLLAASTTAMTFYWYRDTRRYLDDRGIPVSVASPPWSTLPMRIFWSGSGRGPNPRDSRFPIPSDVTHVFTGYWDAYRMAFLSGGRVRGIPLPMYPNRFPGWSVGLGADRGKLLVMLRRSDESPSQYRPAAESSGGRPPLVLSERAPGGPTSVEHKPSWLDRPIDWRPPFTTVWKADGRDPAELDRLQIVIPSPEPARR
jgi:hypothetical protein